MPRTFLIDTDTASDDAVALIMALRAPDVRVAAITVVAGNLDVRQATRNARGPKAKVCWSIDNRRWKEALYKALR